jgi:hypothetical protein
MVADDRTLELREPLSERSRLIRRADVELGLLHDQIVLLQPADAFACVLDERAAELWLECGGQPFAEVLEFAAGSSDSRRREVIELFRALRLFGMVGDAPGEAENFESTISTTWPRATEFRFRGQTIDSGDRHIIEIGGIDLECTLELDHWASTGAGQADVTIVMPGPVHESEHEIHGLEALTALARSAPANPVEVLTRLVATCRIVRRPDQTVAP